MARPPISNGTPATGAQQSAAEEAAVAAFAELQAIQAQLEGLTEGEGTSAGLRTAIANMTRRLQAVGGQLSAVRAENQQQVAGLQGAPEVAAAPAVEQLAAASDGQSGSFFSQLQGIPIDYLIATPLVSAARGNIALAQVMTEFLNTVAYADNTGSGDQPPKTNVLTFVLDQPFQQNLPNEKPSIGTTELTVQAPLLSLVPMPALLVQSVTVDLAVQITNTIASNSSSTAMSTAGATLNAGANWGWGSASFTGSYSNTNSTSATSSQSASQAAQYTINVVAEQQAPTAGMLALSQIFANVIQPMNGSGSKS